MDRREALETIGVEENATPEQVEGVYKAKTEQLMDRVRTANTPDLRAKYENALLEIGRAASVLGVQVLRSTTAAHREVPLSSTQLQDLPMSTPLRTAIDKIAEMEAADPNTQFGLRTGQVLANRYEVIKLIGLGGMGAVYAAFDSNIGEEIAIKVLTPSLLRNEQARERFINEAKTSSRLSHPNIVNFHDVQRDGDLYFITMELLRGRSLRQLLEDRHKSKQEFTIDEVKSVGRQVGEALAFAHATTIHRDVKPENIWMCEDGTVKLMDFGIARVLSTSRLTQTAMVMGTAYYMAPEQLQGSREIDPRADQYALAVVVYEMLTGKIPAGRVKSARVLRNTVPEKMSAAIDKALESNPDDRYPSVQEFVAELSKASLSSRGRRIWGGVAAAGAAGAFAAFLVFTGPGQAVYSRARQYFVPPVAVADAAVKETTQKSITVGWESVSPDAMKIVVMRSEKPDDGYKQVGEVSADQRTFTDDKGIAPEKTYYYKLLTRNRAGKLSEAAKAPAVNVESLPDPPAPPAEIVLTPKSRTEMEVAWKSDSRPESFVHVYRSSTKDGPFEDVTPNGISGAEGAWVDTELQADSTYFYKLGLVRKTVASAQSKVFEQRTRPEPPPNPTMGALTASQKSVKLEWSGDYKPGAKMIVKRSDSQSGVYAVKAQDVNAAEGVFEDTTVQPDTNFFYKLQVDYNGEKSDEIGPIAVTTKPLPPKAPSDVVAELVPPGTLRLRWTGADASAKSYKIRELLPDGKTHPLGERRPDLNSFEAPHSVADNVTLEVVAVNGDVESDVARVVVPAAPDLMTPQAGDSGVSLSWNDRSNRTATKFVVYKVDATNVPKQAGGELTEVHTVDTEAEPGAQYAYFVRAMGSDGSFSDSARQTVAVPPDAPVNIRGSAQPGSIQISWDKVRAKNMAKYVVERREEKTGQVMQFDVDPGASSYTDTQVKANTDYKYRVMAMTSHGGSKGGIELPLKAVGATEPEKPRSAGNSGGSSGRKTASAPAKPTAEPGKWYDYKCGSYVVKREMNGKTQYRLMTADEKSRFLAGNKQPIIEPDTEPRPYPQPPQQQPPQNHPQQPQQQQPPPVSPQDVIDGINATKGLLDAINNM